MNNTFQIKSGLFGNFEVMDYVPTPKQDEILETLKNRQFNIIRKSRQVGITTTLVVSIVERMLNTSGSRVCLVTPNTANAYHVRDLAVEIFKSIDIDEFGANNRATLSLRNGSSLSFITMSSQLSAQKWDWIIFDEAAFIKDLPLMLGMARGMANCNITLASTPTDQSTEFNTVYFGAMKQEMYFKITDFLWHDHPIFGMDIYWTKGENDSFTYTDDKIDDEMRIRLLELGFWRTSDNYEKHLKRYGYDIKSRIEMDAFMVLPPQTAN